MSQMSSSMSLATVPGVDLRLEVIRIAKAIWHRKWLVAMVAWVTAALAAGVISLIPNRYEASAKVYVDTQTVLKPLMAGLAFQPDIDQQVRMLGRTLITRPNVERLVRAMQAKGTDTSEPVDKLVDKLIDKIKVDHAGGNLYVISLRDPQPSRAKAVVSGLVEIFVDSGVDAKQKDSRDASRFIDEQIKSHEEKLVAAENKLKEYKVRNFGVSGVSNQDYFGRMSALSDEIGRLRVTLSAAEESRDALKRELSHEDPQLPPDATAPAVPAPPSETEVRLQTQKRQLDELLRRFTEEHPDVVSTKRIIAQLEAQNRAEVDRRNKAGADGRGAAGSAATSPVFQRIRIALAEAEANVASLRSQLAAQQRRLDEIRSTASRVPQAEAELAQLNRDYEVIRRNYEQLVARREAASLGVKIDQSTPMADFRIVEPPRVAPRAVFPDRAVLAIAGMLGSVALAATVAVLLSRAFPTFDTLRSLQDAIQRPVIGTVGLYRDSRALQQDRDQARKFLLVSLAFVLVNGAWIAWAARSPLFT